MQCSSYLVGHSKTPALSARLADPALHANDAVPYTTVHLSLVAHHHQHLAIGRRVLHTHTMTILYYNSIPLVGGGGGGRGGWKNGRFKNLASP